MAQHSLSGQFTLGADTFRWTVNSYAGEMDSRDTFRGLAARVVLATGKTRELVIEFSSEEFRGKRLPSTPALESRIKMATQQAIEEGWRPDSRGKPFRLTPAVSGAGEI